ncbi:uncharacterized protein BO88DRAFT_463996 [Aspergillus vadensis CBS 113365]|uniref:Uncharacterized protein n=1 Tax=Aspergillus vadensis (strain CBS 113365 / IMI 142717 / IBT 24658) TaxID=1448311 RepID=A0A319CIK9_ASPVC|nr:hypothetical protein BO88DRAFT_463996 [Aspergillus vadensis CBS 113365]PYH68092.1 hypothetical protein BO88DRAFT_463996 [Aspergillus vadensis CBS 113365]
MPKRHYRAWTPGEEHDYPSWVARHLHLTWPERARKYSVERKPRTRESLRTKYRLLEKDIRRHRPPNCKTPSRLRRRIPQRQDHSQRKAWPSSISISTPTPSEHRLDDPSVVAMLAMRQRTPTRVASHQNQNQTVLSTQALILTSQFSAKRGSHMRLMSGLVEGWGNSPAAGNGSQHRASPRASTTSDEINRLWRLAYRVSGRTRQ